MDKRIFKILGTVIFLAGILPSASWSKGGDVRDQIILLNDSAAALEESNPQMARDLTQFAESQEKVFEASNAGGKNAAATPSPKVSKKQQTARIKLLRDSAVLLKEFYPLIAQGLISMANDMAKGQAEGPSHSAG